jgi:hypothetical protein
MMIIEKDFSPKKHYITNQLHNHLILTSSLEILNLLQEKSR